MPGPVPGIHVFLFGGGEDVDGRVKSGHDGGVQTALVPPLQDIVFYGGARP
jgi:hypothetical protein